MVKANDGGMLSNKENALLCLRWKAKSGLVFQIYVRILNFWYTKSSRISHYLAGYKAFLSLKSSLASSFSSYISFCWSVNWSLYFLHYKTGYIKQTIKLSFPISQHHRLMFAHCSRCTFFVCFWSDSAPSYVPLITNRGGVLLLTHSRYFWITPETIYKTSPVSMNMSLIYETHSLEECAKNVHKNMHTVPQFWKFM